MKTACDPVLHGACFVSSSWGCLARASENAIHQLNTRSATIKLTLRKFSHCNLIAQFIFQAPMVQHNQSEDMHCLLRCWIELCHLYLLSYGRSLRGGVTTATPCHIPPGRS